VFVVVRTGKFRLMVKDLRERICEEYGTEDGVGVEREGMEGKLKASRLSMRRYR
jgi:hypothetical protein